MTLPVESWRKLGLFLLLFGHVGTVTELALLGHHETIYQWAPIIMLGLGILAAIGVLARPTSLTVKGMRGLMALYLPLSGYGLFLHLKSNIEFELEMRPSMAGFELLRETLTGAIPALAPGAMAQLGLLGLLVCFRHPALSTVARTTTEIE